MKFTREQYNEIGDNFHSDDFPIDSNNQDLMFEVFNNLPDHIQGLAVQWGFYDSVFGDDVFVFLCKNQYNMTTKEYYKSNYFDNYIEKDEFSFDIEKMKSNK